MNENSTIEFRSVCPECGGTGVITNPAFTSIWEDAVRRFSQPTQEELEAVARAYGFAHVPREEVACLTCDGTGEVVERMTVGEFMKIIQKRITEG